MIAEKTVSKETFARALVIARSANVTSAIQSATTAKTGRPRINPWEAFFVLLAITALEGSGSLILTRAAAVAARLSEDQRREINMVGTMTYRQIESRLADLAAGFHERVNTKTGEVFGPRLDLGLHDFMSRIAAGLIPDAIPITATQSIDSTDYETHYSRQSWGKDKRPDVHYDALPETAYVPEEPQAKNNPGWPLVGADGRLQHTYDPDPRDGYRASKNRSPKGVFVGWDLHLSVDTPDLGGDGLPPLIRAAALDAAGSYKADAGMAVVDALIAQGHTPSLILADRGYTYLKQQMWAMPLHQRGIAQVIDLHKQQRGIRPGPIPGTVYADGGLFTDALPQRLRALPAPTLQMTSEERALLATRYDERTPYAFTTLGKPDRERGTQRYRGPAVTGRVRCLNHLTSMRLSAATRPTTSCTPDRPCACGLTVTLGPDDSFGTRQGPLWGTTKWKASYGRRSAVESANACLKIHHGRLQRHSTRVMGTTRTAILLAFIIAATNTSLLISRYHYDIGDPPADEKQPVASEPNARTALHRKRAFGRRTRATAAVPETAETGSARDGPPPTDDFANII